MRGLVWKLESKIKYLNLFKGTYKHLLCPSFVAYDFWPLVLSVSNLKAIVTFRHIIS